MTFESFIVQAWDDHVRDPQGVADRIDAAKAIVRDEAQFIQLANLVHHLYGDHLNDRSAGLVAMDALTRMPAYDDAGPSGAAVRRFVASLRLSRGEPDVLGGFDPSGQIRILALAISNLTDSDRRRAIGLLHQAMRLAESAKLPAFDPMHEELAQEAHDMAAGIERDTQASPEDLEAMIVAATTARHHWGLVGNGADVFMGEYRLASAWRRAGELAAARAAARNCLCIVERGEETARQRFLSRHVLALIERDAADQDAFAAEARRAVDAYEELTDVDRRRHSAKRAQLTGF